MEKGLVRVMKVISAYDHSKKLVANVSPQLRLAEGQDYEAWKKTAYDKLYDLLGMDQFEKCDPMLEIEWEKNHDEYREIRFTFQSEEGYVVPCHVLLPKAVLPPYKPVICIQGHSKGMHISLGQPKYEGDEASIRGDRDFAVRAVAEGWAAITIEQRYMGECGSDEGTPGCAKHGTAMNALLLGRTAIGERAWDVMRLIDVLEDHFDCFDMDKLMCLGNSGGGTTIFYVACLDERIKCAVPSCSVCTFRDSIGGMKHCGCNYIPGIAKYFDMGDLTGLIAPRKLVITHGKRDPIFPERGVLESYEIAKKMYEKAGCSGDVRLVTGMGVHRFYADDTWPVIHELME